MRYSIAAFACLVALTGCGDDGTSSPQGSGASSPPVSLVGQVNDHGTGDATAGTLELEQDDFYFGPTFVKGKPGASITIELENEGENPHTFTIDSPKVDVEVAAGSKGTATVTLPAAGALAFYCRFHKNQGMQGAFFFNAGDTVPGGATPSSSGDGGAYEK